MAENKDNNITSVMEALVKGAESVFTTKTVVGEATKIDDTIIIRLWMYRLESVRAQAAERVRTPAKTAAWAV